MEPPKNDESDKLISDENFLILMESEHLKAGGGVDEIGKKGAWDRIEKNVGVSIGTPVQKNRYRNLMWAGLLAAGVSAVVFSLRYFEQPQDFGQQVKGRVGDIEFRIGEYLQQPDGELVAWNKKRVLGSVIVPFIETMAPVAVLLVRQIADGAYEAASDAEMTNGGEEHYFSIAGETAAIELEKTAETYCILVSDSFGVMGQAFAALPLIEPGPDLIMECFSL